MPLLPTNVYEIRWDVGGAQKAWALSIYMIFVEDIPPP
jgi:hypothetical protein